VLKVLSWVSQKQ